MTGPKCFVCSTQHWGWSYSKKGLKYFKVLMVRIYMLLHHLVLGSRTYLLLHKCTTLNYVVEKSTFTELLSLLPKRTVGVDIAKKKYRQLQNTSHFKRNLLPHSSFSHVHIIFFWAPAWGNIHGYCESLDNETSKNRKI